MAFGVEWYDDAAAALADAGPFLETQPAAHNLVLTLLQARAATGEAGRYWVVRRDGEPAGLVFQSPLHFRATVTPMFPEAARAAAEAIAIGGIALPGVEGEAATAAAFAGHWTEVCRTAARPTLGMRLHRLGALTLPQGVEGHLERATNDDLPVVSEFFAAFGAEIGEPAPPDAHLLRGIGAGQIAVWRVAGRAVSLGGQSAPVAGISRIGPVYTPPEQRRRGYAAACVGRMSQDILDAGHDCVLYTDLANPTSNSVYRALGYRAIAETVRYAFGDALDT